MPNAPGVKHREEAGLRYAMTHPSVSRDAIRTERMHIVIKTPHTESIICKVIEKCLLIAAS